MPLNDAAMVVAGNAMRDAITHIAIHTAEPNAAGSNQSAAPRQPASWAVDADGDLTLMNLAFTGGAANGPATHVGFWGAASGGTFYGWAQLTNDTAFNAAGQFTVLSLAANNNTV